MRHRIPITLLALLVVEIAVSRANAPPPRELLQYRPPQPQPLPKQPIVAPLTIVVSSEKNPATRLRLSGAALKELRAELPGHDGRHYAGGWTTSSLLAAGTALSLGFVLGGLWLARPRPRRPLVLGLGLAACVCAGVGGCIWLDRRAEVPFTGEAPLRELECNAEGKLVGSLYLEVDDKAEGSKLVIHRQELEQFLDKALQAPPVEAAPGAAPPAIQP